MNRVLFFLGGVLVGATGMAFAVSPKGKKVISDVIQGGSGLKENVTTRMEILKEDIEDYVAEKKFRHSQKEVKDIEDDNRSDPSAEPV